MQSHRTIGIAAAIALIASAAAAADVKEYKYEGGARKHCPRDTVVWGNAEDNVYDMQGAKAYGTGKDGKYVCLGEAKAAGWHDAKDKKEKLEKKENMKDKK